MSRWAIANCCIVLIGVVAFKTRAFTAAGGRWKSSPANLLFLQSSLDFGPVRWFVRQANQVCALCPPASGYFGKSCTAIAHTNTHTHTHSALDLEELEYLACNYAAICVAAGATAACSSGDRWLAGWPAGRCRCRCCCHRTTTILPMLIVKRVCSSH